MTITDWLTNGWALAHLGAIAAAIIIIKVLDRRDNKK